MSNHLYIEVVEIRPINAPKGTFGIVASDDYGTVKDTWYETPEQLFESYPSRLDVMEWLDGKPEFDGSFYLSGNTVTLDCCSGIIWEGFPEDDSIVVIEKE